MKQTKLFGIPMYMKTKVRIIICIVLAVLCLFAYIVLGFFEVPKQEEIIMPKSGLSQSVFDLQNLNYIEVEGYDTVNAFVNLPYTIDVVNGIKASVGNGSVYQYEPYYFYMSEAKQEDALEDVLKQELTDILVYSADPEHTQVTFLSQDSGYINGCRATFYVVEVVAKKDSIQRTAHMCLYRLHFDESIYVTEWDMLVGCMAESSYSTEGLSNLQALSVNAVSTINYDKKKAEQMAKEEKNR